MEFKHTVLSDNCKGNWKVEKWVSNCGNYVISTGLTDKGFTPFFQGTGKAHILANPPNEVECTGCGDSNCPGIHKRWKDLEAAKDACIQHSEELPW